MTVQELYERIGGNYDSAKRVMMMDKFISKYVVKLLDDGSYERLMSAASVGDETGMFEGAHAMKGVCANLGLDSLSAAASAIAEEFRPGNVRTMDQTALDARLQALKAQYDRTVDGIRQYAAEQA